MAGLLNTKQKLWKLDEECVKALKYAEKLEETYRLLGTEYHKIDHGDRTPSAVRWSHEVRTERRAKFDKMFLEWHGNIIIPPKSWFHATFYEKLTTRIADDRKLVVLGGTAEELEGRCLQADSMLKEVVSSMQEMKKELKDAWEITSLQRAEHKSRKADLGNPRELIASSLG